MSHNDATIGVDMGTTDMKAVAFDRAGNELARAEERLGLVRDASGAAEEDADEVADAATRVLTAAVHTVRARGYTVSRVGVSGAMHSVLPVDADGMPLMRALTWMDTRAAAEADTLWSTPEGKALYARTGTPIHPMAPLAKLLWLRLADSGLFGRAARFVSLKEWVWRRWLGADEVDASIASATGLYNLQERDWDAKALALAGISAQQLSTLVPTTAVRRGVRDRVLRDAGLDEQTAFVIGASDGVLANLGVGAIGNEEMVITIGTSCAVRVATSRPVSDEATRAFCYVLAEDRFVMGGPSNSGGIVLEWLARNLLRGQPAAAPASPEEEQALTRLLAAAADATDDELLMLPYLTGERAPFWNARASASVVGLRPRHTGAHVMRAAVEGILFNACWIANGLSRIADRPQWLIASGKVLEAEWIRQLAADIFGLPVVYRGAIDASVVGAARLAEIATGEHNWEEAARISSSDEQVLMPAAHASYASKLARFQQAVDLLA
jgi:gluconokinase